MEPRSIEAVLAAHDAAVAERDALGPVGDREVVIRGGYPVERPVTP